MKPILMQESSKEYQQVVNNATEVAVLSCNPRNNLGKGSNNQNGNLRWFLPWRGGGLEFHLPILKNDFFENHLESFPDY